MNSRVWRARFALALATMIETGDSSDADLMLRGYVSAICARLRMSSDVLDVLQETWASIFAMACRHVTPPKIADQVKTIAYRRAIDIIRKREQFRAAENNWLATQDVSVGFEPDDVDAETALVALLRQLKEDNDRQYGAVTLTLQCSSQEEARARWEAVYSEEITPDNFRQLHSRGVRRMRRYWEQAK